MASTEAITPARFAAALPDLPLSTLALKVAELRNSIAHLDYSNEQLKPFAHPAGAEGDRDCVEAMVENEEVIRRMEERIGLVKAEVERRGASWREVGYMLDDGGGGGGSGSGAGGGATRNGDGADGGMVNGAVEVNGHAGVGEPGVGEGAGVGRHEAWTDGTFQTGTISVGGVVAMNRDAGQGARRGGGTIGDEELRRRLEERMRDDGGADEDGGMHL